MKNLIKFTKKQGPKPDYNDYGDEFASEFMVDLNKWALGKHYRRQALENTFETFLTNQLYDHRLN